MTTQERQIMKRLIPDLLPIDHVSLSTKRIRFIQGQGVILYDEKFAVEIYLPKGSEAPLFFGVHRHHGKINNLKMDFRKLPVMQISDSRVTSVMSAQFDEALFQYQPLTWSKSDWTMPTTTSTDSSKLINAKDIFLRGKLCGAA